MIKSEEISVIIQGPILDGMTLESIKSVKSVLPNAEIIVSTWNDAITDGLTVDYLVKNKDPRGEYYSDNPKIIYSANRQIISTLSGLKVATRKYALKIRSDMYLKHDGFLRYFGKFNKRGNELKLLKERVILSTLNTTNPKKYYPMPYHASDWFFFGLTDDLIDIFDIPLSPEPQTSRWFSTNMFPDNAVDPECLCRYRVEQYIWISFIKKHISLDFDNAFDLSNNNLEKSEYIFSNNSVIIDPIKLGYDSFKHTDHLNRVSLLSPYYSYCDWLLLYKQYCDPKYKLPIYYFYILPIYRKLKSLISCLKK